MKHTQRNHSNKQKFNEQVSQTWSVHKKCKSREPVTIYQLLLFTVCPKMTQFQHLNFYKFLFLDYVDNLQNGSSNIVNIISLI